MTRDTKIDKDWKKELTPEQYHILREQGTEPAFFGKYWNEHGKGTYLCAGCGAELFSSDTKFDSGTGWPSFYMPAREDAVETASDTSHGLVRTEAKCARCGGHLGHVFDDLPAQAGGPKPTSKRFCINSAALEFKQ